MLETITPGFTFKIETIKDGVVVDTEVVHNLMPVEGQNHMLNVLLKSATQSANWYIGIYENDATYTDSITMATLAATPVTETTAYSEGSRVAFVPGTVAAGVVDNSASPADFTMTGAKTIYGGFITSSPTRGGSSGTLLSIVEFASAKVVDNGTVLRVTGGFDVTSS